MPKEALEEQLLVLKRDTSTARGIALARQGLLALDDASSLPALLCDVLQQAIDGFLQTTTSRRHVVAEPGSLTTATSTRLLRECMQIHLNCVRMDPALGVELGAQGTHVQLRRIIQFDLSSVQDQWTEEDMDVIIAMQDLACEIALYAKNDFPMKVSPFTREALRERLPLTFEIRSLSQDGASKTEKDVVDDDAVEEEELVLIHQVTMRQSAQEDVGFGRYMPSCT